MNYTTNATDQEIEKTIRALEKNGISATFVQTKNDALTEIQKLIPKGARVMNGASATLSEIGYTEYLKTGNHGWTDLHAAIQSESDESKRVDLRKQSLSSEYYLGSVHAVTQEGEFLVASNTGSQLPHIVFSSAHLLLIVGTQKIVPTLPDAFERLEKHVVPLENERMMKMYAVGTQVSKIVVFKKENPMMGRSVRVIFVKGPLGF